MIFNRLVSDNFSKEQFESAVEDINQNFEMAGNVIQAGGIHEADEEETDLTLENDWEAITLFGGPRYYKDAYGRVHLAGMCMNGTSEVIGTLPEGYRPEKRAMYMVVSPGSDPRVTVFENGEIFLHDDDNSYCSLAGISFRVKED